MIRALGRACEKFVDEELPDDDDDEEEEEEQEQENDDDNDKYEAYFINTTLHEMIHACDAQIKGAVLVDRPEPTETQGGGGGGGGGGGT